MKDHYATCAWCGREIRGETVKDDLMGGDAEQLHPACRRMRREHRKREDLKRNRGEL